MKRLLQFVVALLVIHAVGIGVFVGWFWMTRMNPQYADALGQMFRGEPLELADEAGATDEQATTRPTSLTADQVQQQQQQSLLEADAVYTQLQSFKAAVEARSATVTVAAKKLKVEKQKWEDEQAARTEQRKNDGFQRAMALYESMKAREVKDIWIGLPEDILVALVRNMDSAKVAKVFKEFRKPEEIEAKRRVLEKIRLGEAGDVAAAALAQAGS